MLITAVIPTRGRPDDLERAVASILAQSRLPDELAIIDQSLDDASRARIETDRSSTMMRSSGQTG